MAKVSMVERERRREKAAAKYAQKRAEFKARIKDPKIPFEERMEAVNALQKLPRDASPTRQQRRCRQTGRPHSVYRKFGLGRNRLREATMNGDVPGLRKASW